MDRRTVAGALHRVDEPRPAVHRGLPEPIADLRLLALVHATLDLPAVRVLPDPDRLRLDARARRGRSAVLPDRLRVERRLLPPRDLPQRLPQLLGGRVAPIPEAAPDAVNAQQRVEHEREWQVREVLRVGELEQVEVARDRPVL